ncbi:hypothetical protein FRC08_004842 [Ceratobasidium sp. 394]|nr:hypothetical protein FRC08_004842 [Ceratobasidium sp. 394]
MASLRRPPPVVAVATVAPAVVAAAAPAAVALVAAAVATAQTAVRAQTSCQSRSSLSSTRVGTHPYRATTPLLTTIDPAAHRLRPPSHRYAYGSSHSLPPLPWTKPCLGRKLSALSFPFARTPSPACPRPRHVRPPDVNPGPRPDIKEHDPTLVLWENQLR